MSERGLYITVEGLEGAGKTNVVPALVKRLESRGFEVLTVVEPGGTPLGEALRNIVKHADYVIEPVAEAMLFAAARRQLWIEVVEPALKAGKCVVSDRSLMTSYAYQGGGREVMDQVLDLAAITYGAESTPFDLLVYLDIPVEVGLQRASARGALDRIESEGPEFLERASNYYQDFDGRFEIADYFASFIRIDATQDMATVAKASVEALDAWLEEYNNAGISPH